MGGFTNLVFVGFENFLEGNDDELAFTVLETFLEGRGEGGFTQLAFIGCDSRGDGSGIAWAAWCGREHPPRAREMARTASAIIRRILNHIV